MPANAKGNETQAGVSEPIGQSSDAPYKQTPRRKRSRGRIDIVEGKVPIFLARP